ncbi:MAG: hypothetical protein U1F49_14520 [Rubrivivax sp.]
MADHDQRRVHYKWIVAEAAKKALGLSRIEERVFIVKLVNDKNDPSRIAGTGDRCARTRSTSTRPRRCCSPPARCVNLFRPRSVGEGNHAWASGMERERCVRDGR